MYIIALLKFTVALCDIFAFPTQYLLERMTVSTRIVSQPHASTHFHDIDVEF
jgi:hypothetical protein